MKRFVLAIALLTFCSACATERVAVSLRPDRDNPDRLICEVAGPRPAIPTEYRIDWSKVATVEQAKVEHEAFVRSIRTREGVVAGYLVDLEGRLFVCSNNAQWWRDYWKALPE